jgi:hypothetical protein
MKRFLLAAILCLSASVGFSQDCTITASANWVNGTAPTCVEGGTPTGKTNIIIPAGITVTFDNNGDTWTGANIHVYGTLTISFNATINSSIKVYNGGRVNLGAKLDLGSSGGGCDYTMVIYTGGTVDVGITGSDRLSICGVDIMKGNGACNPCPACPYDGTPYCEPSGGFTGPLGYSSTGFDGTLPISLLYFTASLSGDDVLLDWATASEENFQKFVVERSQAGVVYEPIGEVMGAGQDIFNIESTYDFTDHDPLLGFNYYRLKAVDLDGYVEYFDVRVVKLDGAKQLAVYPNPTTGSSMKYDINFNPSDDDLVVLINSLGVELCRQKVSEFRNELAFNNPLGAGVYILKYVSPDFETATRVIVH